MLDKIANRYTVESLIGQGGMADVYVAFDEILKRKVAIKILRTKLADDPLILVRFTREASAASRLSHPNVVDIYDVGEHNGLHYIVMEYIKGRTLKQLLAHRGALDLYEALSIMKQLTSGVAAAHASGIIHRDIKPQNILMKADGTAKITDFGIAVANGAVSLTHNNAVMGSAHYLAPESAQGRTPNAQVDIYSLGIVFYELLSGQVPFAGTSPAEIALKHMQQPMPSIRKLNPEIPQSVENIITRATAKDPRERYSSLTELQYDLDHCLDSDRIHEPALVLKVPSMDLSSATQKHKKSQAADGSSQSIPSRSRSGAQNPARQTNQKTQPSRKTRLGNFVKVSIVSLIAILIGAVFMFSIGIFRIPGMFGYETFPSLLNLSYEQAVQTLQSKGFSTDSITVTKEVSDSVEEGKVISSEINPGKVVPKDSPISLVVSKGPSFLISDYTGQYLTDVEEYFKSQGLNMSYDIEYQGQKNMNPGVILAQAGLEPGARIDPDEEQSIHFIVSQYPSIVLPESLIGMNIDQAVNWLNEQGIAVYAKDVEGSNKVTKTDPPVGTEYTQEGTDEVVILYH
ncbi:MAG: Stk1 family PASTA domain-containing Ser/Thr kinase [Ileibacterium sp.]|nr:Stk1 family PASTA domain-containing Ser/Thr kinase [Ileibacterium sp.]